MVETLRELGAGFSFVGRQVHFDVDGDDFFVDLLFFNWQQVRFVVVELKTSKFDPRDAGQLGFTSRSWTIACASPSCTHPRSGSCS